MVRRYAAKSDSNQKEIKDALEKAGASVHDLKAAGEGFPDLAVGYMGVTYLMEVIGPDKLKRFRKNGGLSDNQVEWHDAWRGHCCAVKDVDEALGVIGVVQIPQEEQ